TTSSDDTVGGRGLGGMVGYARRRVPRERPSKDQRKFLEVLRDLGPQDSAQTAAIRKITKRACQVRGWVEWRCIDQCPGMRAWHLTVIGRNALKVSNAKAIISACEGPAFDYAIGHWSWRSTNPNKMA